MVLNRRSTRILFGAALVVLVAGAAFAQPYTCEEVMVPMRDGTHARHRRLHAQQPGRRSVARHPRADAVQQGRLRAPVRAVFRPARLRRDRPGRARPLQLGGRLPLAARPGVARAPGRLRHHRVGGHPALVHREGGDAGALVHLLQPVPDRADPAAAPGRHVLRALGVERLQGPLLGGRRAPHDHADLAAVAERDGPAGAARRSRAADRLRRRRPGLDAVAPAAARDRGADGPEHAHPHDDRHDREPVLQRLLAAVRGRRAVGPDRHPDHALRELVRPVPALAGGALQRHPGAGHGERPRHPAAVHRALAPRGRPHQRPGDRRSRLRARGGHRLQRAAPEVVRLPPEGHRQRHHGRAEGEPLHHGREQLAAGERVPARPRGADRLLLPGGEGRLDRLAQRRDPVHRSARETRRPTPTSTTPATRCCRSAATCSSSPWARATTGRPTAAA